MEGPYGLPGALALIDIAIAITLLEGVALLVWRASTGRGLAALDLLPNLCAGLALMAVVRAALTGADWGWMAMGLAASGLAHGIDMHRRWRRQQAARGAAAALPQRFTA